MKQITIILGADGYYPFLTEQSAQTSFAYGGTTSPLQLVDAAKAASEKWDRPIIAHRILTNKNTGELWAACDIDVQDEMPEMVSIADQYFPMETAELDQAVCSTTQGEFRTVTYNEAMMSAMDKELRIITAWNFDRVRNRFTNYIALDKKNDAYMLELTNVKCSWDGITREEEKDIPLQYTRELRWNYIEDNWHDEFVKCFGDNTDIGTGYTASH